MTSSSNWCCCLYPTAAREELVGEIRYLGSNGKTPGPDPEHQDYQSFADFSDPDGNTWMLQERDYKPAG